MDGSRFDTFTRSFSLSRRTTLVSLLGGALGLLHAPGQKAAADCKKVGRSCVSDSQCCQGAECRGAECKCKSNREECDGKCFNLESDEEHCGDCATACAGGESCCSGACADVASDGEHCGACGAACAAGQTCCDGGCVDLESNQNNCGACGARCDFFASCEAGVCESIQGLACIGETTKCGDECVDLQKNRDHCGACGNGCADGARCCAGVCVDVDTDENNCGSCGVACEDQACCAGQCVYLSDMNNCGACGYVCPSGTVSCAEGVCCRPGDAYPRSNECLELGWPCCDTEPLRPCSACTASERCCNDVCREVKNDRLHCGRCGNACDQTSTCQDGDCWPCPPGRVACGNVCCFP